MWLLCVVAMARSKAHATACGDVRLCHAREMVELKPKSRIPGVRRGGPGLEQDLLPAHRGLAQGDEVLDHLDLGRQGRQTVSCHGTVNWG